jgi:Trk K+ transport system NAD-binding subunit
MVIKTFSGHTIVGGTGEMGKALVRQILLESPDEQIVLIDPRPGIMIELGIPHENAACLQADMTDIEILVKAGIARAKLIILTAGEDAINLESAYKVLKIAPNVEIWIRLHHNGLAELLDLARKPNIHFFCPYNQAAHSITRQLLSKA